MFVTKFGPHNGNTWEALFQQIFKKRYGEEGYQEMVASPGDFGIEGYTKSTGLAFQCYCPDKQYTQQELYEKQRDKITKDLGKIKKFENQLKNRLGDTKLTQWIFVTPEVNQNYLLAHAQTKQDEARKWGLSILDKDFTVLVRDGEFYSTEISHFQTINGEKLVFDESIPSLSFHERTHDLSDYENNIRRKNKIRCDYESTKNENKLKKINDLTIKKWLEGEGVIKRIESSAPKIYHHLARVISQYEDEVAELSLSWQGKAEELTNNVRENLYIRLQEELPDMSPTDQRRISDHMVAKWIALCPLDYE
ncbi:MAG: hypothetical protein AB2809_06610 [Candidatus Thiodiazotropha sp.]